MAETKTVVGILAQVDAGKTTLAEAFLYKTGSIRKAGRVDHGDSFLDTGTMERERGITVFAKQAQMVLQHPQRREIILLDTPGHVDFSAEMERTLQVMDMAILVISGADGVQGQVETLWKLLGRYGIPTLIFINKMDQPGLVEEECMAEVAKQLSSACVNFSNKDWESIAMCTEMLMEEYLEKGEISKASITESIEKREIFPVFFGSGLKMIGVDELLLAISAYAPKKEYPSEFGARVFKIERDKNGRRMTKVKLTGGAFPVKGVVNGEKVDQIRVYSGENYELRDVVYAGEVCNLVGPEKTFVGQGLGYEKEGMAPSLLPVLSYQVYYPEDCDIYKALNMLKTLEEEIPELHIKWEEQNRKIYVQMMGQVQMQILEQLFQERFGIPITFGQGEILYKETLGEKVRGIGHYEPLRHYAEVVLGMEPLERGQGIVIDSMCQEDDLDRNWQRLIMTNIEEKKHLGVLTGSELTDVRIVILGGRAHNKHTEGGDFRQAVYRAIRQGLMQARSILLEPFYEFTITVPKENIGRVMTDIKRKYGSFSEPELEGEFCILKGKVPVEQINDYSTEVMGFTKGRGRVELHFLDYEPCHNEEEVIQRIHYNAAEDTANTADSVFCAHGAGFVVPWYDVERYAHVNTDDCFSRFLGEEKPREKEEEIGRRIPQRPTGGMERVISQEEIEEIFLQSYGKKPVDKNPWNRPVPVVRTESPKKEYEYRPKKKEESYLLVDGYNIIYSWPELRELLENNVDGARSKLMELLCNYAGCIQSTIIVVFDAYRVKPNEGVTFPYQNIHVVYTKEAETADQYIEKTVHALGKKYQVTVATSDGLEQIIIWGQGALRMSARQLKEEMERVTLAAYKNFKEEQKQEKYYPFRQALSEVTEKKRPD